MEFENFLRPIKVSGTLDYIGIDHPDYWEYQWKQIKKEYPDAYHDNTDAEIKYKINSNGYRCKEFNEIDWKNFVLFLGCSNTFGQGIPVDFLASSLLEKKLNIDCVNLGVPGGSNMLMSDIALHLVERGICPKLVVVGWTTHNRIYDVVNSQIENLGIWSTSWYSFKSNTSKDFYKQWVANDERTMYQSKLARRQIKHYFKDVKILEYTYRNDIANNMNCFYINNDKNSRARDGYHESYKYHKEIYSWITKNV
jgi:hypothetical protein